MTNPKKMKKNTEISEQESKDVGGSIFAGMVMWIPVFLVFAQEHWVNYIGILWAFLGWFGYSYYERKYRKIKNKVMKNG